MAGDVDNVERYGLHMIRMLMRLTLLLVLAIVAVFSLLRIVEQKPHNLVFICVDTLRPDRLGYNGHTRDTSPNIDSLAEAIVKLAGNAPLRREMGRRGRDLVERELSWRVVAERFLQ